MSGSLEHLSKAKNGKGLATTHSGRMNIALWNTTNMKLSLLSCIKPTRHADPGPTCSLMRTQPHRSSFTQRASQHPRHHESQRTAQRRKRTRRTNLAAVLFSCGEAALSELRLTIHASATWYRHRRSLTHCSPRPEPGGVRAATRSRRSEWLRSDSAPLSRTCNGHACNRRGEGRLRASARDAAAGQGRAAA